MRTAFVLCTHLFSTEPREVKKEYIIPLIKQNNWRLPVKTNKKDVNDEGNAASGSADKSDEQLSLEEEAAQAIIKGEETNTKGGGCNGIACPLLSELMTGGVCSLMHHTTLSKVQVVQSGMVCPSIKILEICSWAGGLGQ